MRPDVIEGRVLEVVGTSTIDIEVLRTGEYNRLSYGRRERVRMIMTKTPGGDDGRSPAARVFDALRGRRVKVLVHARDRDAMVIGDVEVIPPGAEPQERSSR